MTIPHAILTHQVVYTLSEETPETDTDRLRAIQRPKHIRPLLPIEMEKTRQTPAISMSVIPESVRHAAVQMPTTPVQVQISGPLQDVHTPAPMKHPRKGSHESRAHGTPPVFSVADVAECAEIMGPAGVNAVFYTLPFARAPMVISQMERRDRIVFLLLDGKRTLRDVARLIHRSELDVARIVVRLWKWHFIER